jgi:hypothetical protein
MQRREWRLRIGPREVRVDTSGTTGTGNALCPELLRQVSKVLGNDIKRRIRRQVGASIWPAFQWTRHKGGAEAFGLGSVQVSLVGGHHHDVVWPEVE